MYGVVRSILRLLFGVFFRWTVIGIENIPTQGGLIIASNHVSLWDPPLIGAALPRSLHFMAKDELFKVPVFNWVITKLYAFPVKRGLADRTAIRKAISLLEEGEIVGLFPEGTRSKNGELGKPEPGLAMIATKAGVPIVPTAIIGTNKIGKKGTLFPKFTIIFGKPISVNQGKTDKEMLEAISVTLMQDIACLLKNK